MLLINQSFPSLTGGVSSKTITFADADWLEVGDVVTAHFKLAVGQSYQTLPTGFVEKGSATSPGGYVCKIFEKVITDRVFNPSYVVTFNGTLPAGNQFGCYIMQTRGTQGIESATASVNASSQTLTFPASSVGQAQSSIGLLAYCDTLTPTGSSMPPPPDFLEKMVSQHSTCHLKNNPIASPGALSGYSMTWTTPATPDSSVAWTIVYKPAPAIAYPPYRVGTFGLGVVGRDGGNPLLNASALTGAKRVRLEYDSSDDIVGGAIDGDFIRAAEHGLKIMVLYSYGGTLPTQAQAENFCSQIAARYGPGGDFWDAHPELDSSLAVTEIEFGNESGYNYWGTGIHLQGGTYATRAKQAAIAMTAANPAVGLLVQADDGATNSGWVNSMFTAEPTLDSYVTKWTAHMYGPSADTKLDVARTALTGRSTKPFWITETGIATHETSPGIARTLDDNFGWPVNQNYAQAASNLAYTFAAWQSKYGSGDRRIEWVFYYQNSDQKPRTDPSVSREHWFGLLEWDSWGSWIPKGALYTTWLAFAGGTIGDVEPLVSLPTLNEEYLDPHGEWETYDAYDPILRDKLRDQKHIDIRNFVTDDTVAPLSVLDLSQHLMSWFHGQQVQALDDSVHVLQLGEHWTVGLTTSLATANYWRVLQVALSSGTITTESVMTNPIDLLSDFEDDDFISLALPAFPAGQITQASSFIDLTSNPDGNFTAGPTASVALSASTLTLTAGDSEFRVLRSAFNQNSINLAAITGVRIRIAATGTATLNLAALRLLAKTWRFSTLDVDTRAGTLVRPVAPNGNPARAVDFSFPAVWRSAEVPGQEDPKPINFNLAVGFNTGSRVNSNQITIYGRELTEDFMQQLDLNGLRQSEMTGRDQPDVGAAMYNERVQTDLEPFKQDQLAGLEQYDLERTADYLSASWIEFVLTWTSTNTQLNVQNNEGGGYTFNIGTPLSVKTNYVLVFELDETAARAAIYPLGDRGQIIFNAPVFDSTRIDDDFVYKRRKGRFGWFANLADGDAYIDSIRFRSAMFAEYRSLPYESITPVDGAELVAESSPVVELFDYFVPTLSPNVVVERDREVSTTGESWRVTDYGPYTFEGIQSNPFPITDFNQTEILLDVYYPSSGVQDASVEFFLKSQYDYLIPLPKPKIYPDQWQTVRLRTPSAHLAQTGTYRLVAVQNRPANLNWWIDNVRIFERTVSWYGRSVVEDPWAATEDDWTPFQNAANRDFGGILFQDRGRKMQIKAVGHKQESTVSKVQFKPKYAELGRFVWPENALTGRQAPTASYSTTNNGRIYTFNGFGSSDPDGMIINWYWTVSDGSVYVGPVVQHTFGQSGTYAVTLTVMDQNGLVGTTSSNHSVA